MAFYTYHFSPLNDVVVVVLTKNDQSTTAPRLVGAAKNRTEAVDLSRIHYEKIKQSCERFGRPVPEVFYP